MFDGRWRSRVDRASKPMGSAIRRAGFSADHLTVLGLVMAVATAVAVGSGRLGLGLLLLAATGLCDLLDGPVAKASGTAGPRGAFFDSVADRVSDALLFGGVAWHLASDQGGHAAVLPLSVLATSGLISYERAKAESLGFEAKGGLMERAERIIALWVGLAFSALLVPVLWLMLVLTSVTAVQRFVAVWRQAGSPRARTGHERLRARRGSRLRSEAAPGRGARARRGETWPPRRRERSWTRQSRTRP